MIDREKDKEILDALLFYNSDLIKNVTEFDKGKPN